MTRDVAPEDTFFVARLHFEQPAILFAVGTAYMVIDAGRRLIERLPSGPVQTEGDVHILEISAERFGKAT